MHAEFQLLDDSQHSNVLEAFPVKHTEELELLTCPIYSKAPRHRWAGGTLSFF